MRTFFSGTVHASLMFGSRARRLDVFAQKSSHLCVMSLLGVHVCRFPPIASSSTCFLLRPSASSTLLIGTRSLPCASAPWGGMFGSLANRAPDTHATHRPCQNDEQSNSCEVTSLLSSTHRTDTTLRRKSANTHFDAYHLPKGSSRVEVAIGLPKRRSKLSIETESTSRSQWHSAG